MIQRSAWRRKIWPAVLAGSLGAQSPPITARQILTRALRAQRANAHALEHYSWLARERNYKLGSHERLGKNISDVTYQVTQVDGVQYQIAVADQGRPLSAKQKAKVQKKRAKFLHHLEHETPAQRTAFRRKLQKSKRRLLRLEAAIPRAFHLQLEGMREIRRGTVYVIAARPNPAYQARSQDLKMLRNFTGTLWIDTRSFSLVHADIHVLHTISFTWGLGRLERGTRMTFDNAPIHLHWFPRSMRIQLTLREFYIHVVRLSMREEDYNYHRIRVSTRTTKLTY